MSNAPADPNPMSDPVYQKFVEDCAESCSCPHGVCDGVLAGGFCDEIGLEDDIEEARRRV